MRYILCAIIIAVGAVLFSHYATKRHKEVQTEIKIRLDPITKCYRMYDPDGSLDTYVYDSYGRKYCINIHGEVNAY